jgi:hypothetical protein
MQSARLAGLANGIHILVSEIIFLATWLISLGLPLSL